MSSKPLLQTLNPPGVAAKSSYSHISTFTIGEITLITFAGQVGRHPDHSIPSTYVEQVSCALQNVQKCLEAVEATTRDIMKVTLYCVIAESEEWGQGMHLYEEFVGNHRPPVTLVPVERLAGPELLFEIEVMAAKGRE